MAHLRLRLRGHLLCFLFHLLLGLFLTEIQQQIQPPHGPVLQSTMLEVPVANGKRHGFGLRVFANGSRYKGTWANDKMDGRAGLLFSLSFHSLQYFFSLFRVHPHCTHTRTSPPDFTFSPRDDAHPYTGPAGEGELVQADGGKFDGVFCNGLKQVRAVKPHKRYSCRKFFSDKFFLGAPSQHSRAMLTLPLSHSSFPPFPLSPGPGRGHGEIWKRAESPVHLSHGPPTQGAQF